MNPRLLSQATKTVVWGVSGRPWHIHGPGGGFEGVTLISQTGHMFAPTNLLVSEGAREDGATFLRSVRSKKEWDFIVLIKGRTVREFHAIHDAWFRDWSTDRAGTVGVFTKHQGWRHQHFQLDGPPEPLTKVDPARSMAVQYQMSATAMDPLEHHFDDSSEWVNDDGFGEGIVRGRNAADQPAWPRYTMNGPGRFHIGDPVDGDTSRIVETPVILAGEELRIDTHPRHRTARVYSDALPSGRNVWAQLNGRRWFASLPPWSSTDITVRVTDGGTIESTVRVDVSPRSSRPY